MPLIRVGEGVMVVMPETDVTAKTVLGEPENGSADHAVRRCEGGLLGAGNDCCPASNSS